MKTPLELLEERLNGRIHSLEKRVAALEPRVWPPCAYCKLVHWGGLPVEALEHFDGEPDLCAEARKAQERKGP